jgi:hypothetical protein
MKKKKLSDLRTSSVWSAKAKGVKGGAKAGVTAHNRPVATRAPAARRKP